MSDQHQAICIDRLHLKIFAEIFFSKKSRENFPLLNRLPSVQIFADDTRLASAVENFHDFHNFHEFSWIILRKKPRKRSSEHDGQPENPRIQRIANTVSLVN
jgi:hypothetical protein